MFGYTPQSLYLRGKISPYALNRRLGGLCSMPFRMYLIPVSFGEDKKDNETVSFLDKYCR
jgi:hypothetical protein